MSAYVTEAQLEAIGTIIGDRVKSAIAAAGGGGAQQVFVQQTRPTAAGPWVWWETDTDGEIVDLTVNDGVA